MADTCSAVRGTEVSSYRGLAASTASLLALHRLFGSHPVPVDTDQRETLISLNFLITLVRYSVVVHPAFIQFGNTS
jgi:hypothetical protein